MSKPERVNAKLADALARFSALRPPASCRDDERSDAAERRRERRERMYRLGITLDRKVVDKVLADEDLLDTVSLTSVRSWMRSPDLEPVIIVVGCAGCGKSLSAAVAALNFAGTCVYTTGQQLVRLATASFGPEAQEFRQLKGAELAIVDDVLTPGDPARECAAIIEFIDARKHRKSILTTNLAQSSDDETQETWETRFADPRLHSRLKESVVFVYDDGPDLRGRV